MNKQYAFCFIVSLVISACGYQFASQQLTDWSLFLVGVTLLSWTILAQFAHAIKHKLATKTDNLRQIGSHSEC